MAEAMDYVNPIIQAMVQAHQLNQQRATLAQQAQEFKDTKALREHQLQLEETKAEHEHEHAVGTLKVQQDLATAQMEQNRLNRIKEARDLSVSGFSPDYINRALSSIGGQQIQGLPTTQDLQEAEANRIRQTAGAKTTGEMTAAEPFKIRDDERAFTNRMALQNAENEFKGRLTDKEIASHERIAKLSSDTQKILNQATNATHLQVAGMQYTPTPDSLRAMIVAGSTGAAKLNYANPQERAALGTIHSMGGREVDPKDLQALKEGQQLIPLFDQLEKFADSLPSSRTGAFISGKTLAAKNWAGWSSKQQTDLSNINAQALNVGRAVEGMTGGRVLAKQLELDLNSLTSGAITKEDAISKLKNLRDLYTNKMENSILGGTPDWQKELIQKTYGIKSATEIQAGSTVKMKAPTGETMDVPRDQVNHYKSKGATTVE